MKFVAQQRRSVPTSDRIAISSWAFSKLKNNNIHYKIDGYVLASPIDNEEEVNYQLGDIFRIEIDDTLSGEDLLCSRQLHQNIQLNPIPNYYLKGISVLRIQIEPSDGCTEFPTSEYLKRLFTGWALKSKSTVSISTQIYEFKAHCTLSFLTPMSTSFNDDWLYNCIRNNSWGIVTSQTLVVIENLESHWKDKDINLESYDETRHIIQLFLYHSFFESSSDASSSSLSQKGGFSSLLLYGPFGCGKTTIVFTLLKNLEMSSNVSIIRMDATKYLSKEGDNEMSLVYQQALCSSPAVIVLDDIEKLFPSTNDPSENSLLYSFLSMLYHLESNCKALQKRITLISLTSNISLLNENIKSCFQCELEIDIPSPAHRLKIFRDLVSKLPLAPETFQSIEKLNSYCSGYLGSDLAAVCQSSLCTALSRSASVHNCININPNYTSHPNHSNSNFVDNENSHFLVNEMDFMQSIRARKPSMMRMHTTLSIPYVRWDDLGGLEEVKQQLREMVILPQEKPHAFQRLGILPPKGILMYGPPGTGKTMLAKATASESKCNFINVAVSDLISSALGESQKEIAKIFHLARRYEFQALFGSRDTSGQLSKGLTSQLLLEMDTLCDPQCGIVVIGATNCPKAIDPAFLRPGRFDNIVYVGIPDALSRKSILERQTSSMPLEKNFDPQSLVPFTNGFTGADIANLCRQAAMLALGEESCEIISKVHFMKALEVVKPSTSPTMLYELQSWSPIERSGNPFQESY